MMTEAEFSKKAGSGPYKGQFRSEIFKIKIAEGKKFTLTNGQQVIGLKYDPKTKELLTKNKIKIKLSKIKKDADLGGGRGSGGGAEETKITESGQCYVTSVAFNVLKRAIKFEDLTEDNLQAGAKFVNATMSLDEIIEKTPDQSWTISYITTTNKLFKDYKFQSPAYFHRGDSFMKSIYDAKKECLKNDRASDDPQAPGSFSDDKWNPGDIWISESTQVPDLPTSDWGALNSKILELGENRKLLGVSLKKVGTTARIDEFNERNEIIKPSKYKSFRVSSKTDRGKLPPFFNSIDLYMTIDNKEVQFRSTSGESSWQGEIKGATAAGGKIGGGNINLYLKKATGKSLWKTSEKEILAETKQRDFFKDFYALYKKHFRESGIEGEMLDYNDFVSNAKQKAEESDSFLFSKYMNMRFIDIFLSASIAKRDKIATDIMRYAASNTDQSSYYVKVFQ